MPDLPLEESPSVLRGRATSAGIALVPLVAPTTPDERLARIGAQARGFVYTVSVTGTTGERAATAEGLTPWSSRVREHTDRPGRGRLRHRDARAGVARSPTAPTA